MCTGGQAFDESVPEEIAPIWVRIESDDLNRFRAICSVIKQQLDPLRTSTEDREVDPLSRPGCPGRESRTGPCRICFQSADSLRTNYPTAELISCFVVLILFMFLHLEPETSESV